MRIVFLLLACWAYEISVILNVLFWQGTNEVLPIVLRLLTLFLGILVVSTSFNRLVTKNALILILFGLFYLFRITLDFQLFGIYSVVGGGRYILLHLGSSLLPSIFIIFSRFNHKDLVHFSVISIVIIALTLAVSIKTGLSDYLASMFLHSGSSIRLYTTGISPIQLGNLGVSLLLMLFLANYLNILNVAKIVNFLLGILGLLSVVLANSKGPFIVLALLILVHVSQSVTRTSKRVLLLFGLASLIFAISIILESFIGIDVFDRFKGVTKENDVSTMSRLRLWKEAFHLFLKNPLYGSRSVTMLGAYPHNIILEILMSLGLIGLGLMLKLFIGLRRLFNNRSLKYLLIMLVLQTFTAYLFSFGLFQAHLLFVLCALIFNTSLNNIFFQVNRQ